MVSEVGVYMYVCCLTDSGVSGVEEVYIIRASNRGGNVGVDKA